MADMPPEGGASDARRAAEEEEEDVPMPDVWRLNEEAKALSHPQVFSTAEGLERQEVGEGWASEGFFKALILYTHFTLRALIYPSAAMILTE
ncbi:hypothetical protein FOPE_10913 [Fonsecaea pedrosoi]|nr:hypothetical protein FOPE_10913 [Fonsecaea pedrosoi]